MKLSRYFVMLLAAANGRIRTTKVSRVKFGFVRLMFVRPECEITQRTFGCALSAFGSGGAVLTVWCGI
jgi:hypothetical protein